MENSESESISRTWMKIPNKEIYWSRLLPFLALKDAAMMEIAVDNHSDRQALEFSMPAAMDFSNPMSDQYSKISSSSSSNRVLETPYSVYGTIVNPDVTFVITSEDKLTWLLKRGIYPTDVSLEVVPLMREDASFLHFMGNIRVLQMKASCSIVGWIFHLLKSLEKFIAHENKSVDDIFIQGFVNQCRINANRNSDQSSGVGPHKLHTMAFNMEKLSVKTVEHLVTGLPNVKAIRLNDGNSTSFRHHLDLVAKNLSSLTSIEIWNTGIYDSALEPFKRVELPLERIKLFRCNHLTEKGLRDLTTGTTAILELTLEQMNITQTALVAALPAFPSLKKLTLWNNYNRYSDVILKGLSKFCPELAKCRIHQDAKGDSYTEDGIQSLTAGCSMLEELELSCENLSYTTLHILLDGYKYQMRQLWVPEKVLLKLKSDDGFIEANWRIRKSEST